jgi:hypothetical protein
MSASNDPSNLSSAQSISLQELVTTLESISEKLQSPILAEASMRLRLADDAAYRLEEALIYVSRNISIDNASEMKRSELFQYSEILIKIIREGGRYP